MGGTGSLGGHCMKVLGEDNLGSSNLHKCATTSPAPTEKRELTFSVLVICFKASFSL